MPTRIKYNRVANLIYTDWFTLGPNFIIKGIINKDTYKFQVVEFNSELVFEGQGNNLRDAKTKLKETMINAGVNFTGEIRKVQ